MTKSTISQFLRSSRILGLLFIAASVALAGTVPTILIVNSVGPNGDASFIDYAENAAFALEHGLSAYGTPGTPGYYAASTGSIYSGGMISTPTFNSWLGSDTPGPAYSGEFGNAIFFGLYIYSETAFRLPDVTWSNPVWGSADLSGIGFSRHMVGMSGATRHDTTTGSAGSDDLTPINQLWYSGVSVTAPIYTSADLPAALSTYAFGSATVRYTLNLGSAEATYTADSTFSTGIPEPGTLSLMALGFGGLFFFRRKCLG